MTTPAARMDIAAARDRILGAVATLAPLTVPLEDAIHSVLASPVIATTDEPPFDNSAMDGYAVRSADVATPPVELRVVDVSSAGHPAARPVGPGEAARILTGAMSVDGADAVVRVEDTDGGVDRVVVHSPVTAGANLRRRGEGARAGQVVLEPGTLLNPGHLGVAASAGLDRLEVIAAPSVAVLSTGDELVADASVELGTGQIRESNSIVIAGLARGLGCAVSVHRCGDDPAAMRVLIEELGATHDLVLTSGGVSMGGEYDTVRDILSGRRVEFWRLSIRPAKPFAFGVIGRSAFFGLPGNPVSAVVAFELLVRPAIRKLRGIAPNVPPTVVGITGEALARRDDSLTHYLRVRRENDGRWVSTGTGGSHLLGGIAAAEALAVLDPTTLEVPVGATVSLVPLWT